MNTELPPLNPSELEVMKQIWDLGPASVREVHDRLEARLGWAYSTTKTVMDRMVRKGFLARHAFHGVLVYQPELSRPQGLAALARDFAARVLEAGSESMVPLFARRGALSEEELAELERLLEEEQK